RRAETDGLRREQQGMAEAAIDLPADPRVQWDALAARCRDGTTTVILDASLLQTALVPLFAADAPVPVYLRPSDIDATIARVHAARGADWAAWNIASVADFPWAQRRGLTGRAAVIGFYRAWEPLVDALRARYPFPHLLLTDPQQDRAATRRGV